MKPVADVFGKRGRAWLAGLELSAGGPFGGGGVAARDRPSGRGDRRAEAGAGTDGRADARARCLQTVPGIGAYSAMVILAEMAMWSASGTSTRWPAMRADAGGERVGGQTQARRDRPPWIRTRCAGSCCRWRRWRRGARQRRAPGMRG